MSRSSNVDRDDKNELETVNLNDGNVSTENSSTFKGQNLNLDDSSESQSNSQRFDDVGSKTSLKNGTSIDKGDDSNGDSVDPTLSLNLSGKFMNKLRISGDQFNDMVNPNGAYEKSNRIEDDEFPIYKPSENKVLEQTLDREITILDANKVTEGQGRSYISYSIKYGTDIVRRRYSDFEIFRSILVKLFPINVIPCIPEKQSLKNYGKSITNKNTTYILPSEGSTSVDLALSNNNGSISGSEETFIRHRIRMLTSFLNKLLNDEDIMNTTIVTDFLDPNITNWSDFVNSSATFSSLPKSVLQCNPLDPTNTTRIHACLPIPPSSNLISSTKERKEETVEGELEKRDQFELLEIEYKKYEAIMKNGVYKHNRRITKNWKRIQEDMNDLSELFAHLSNNQRGKEAMIAELTTYMSNAYDESSIQLENLVSLLYYNIDESFNEAVYDAESIRELLKYRRLKNLQLNLIKSTLESKNVHLQKLEQKENEDKALSGNIDNELDSSKGTQNGSPQSTNPGTYSGLLKKKFHKLAHMVKESLAYQDTDPKTTMDLLRKEIPFLEESLQVAESDLEIISNLIIEERLSKYSVERQNELSKVLANYSKYMMEYAQKNLEIWKLIKDSQDR